MSIGRILGAIAAFIGVVVLAVVLYLLFADLSKYRPDIESAVADATGREFRINGNFELDVLPSPRVVMEQVTLANADWGSEPLMLDVGHLSAEVGLWSLLFGPIDVREFRLRDVRTLLETNEDGTGNWEMGPPESEPPPPEEGEAEDAALPVVIQFAELKNINLTFRQPETDDQNVGIAQLTIQPDDAGNLGLAGTGTVLGLALGLDGEVGPLRELQALGGVDYRVGGNLGSLTYEVNGRTEDLETFDGTNVKTELATETIEELLAAVGAESALAGPLRVTADLTHGEESTNLKVDAALSEVETQSDTTFAGDSVTFEVSMATMAKLGELLEVQGLPEQALTVNGSAVMGAEAIRISELVANLGSAQARVQGTLARGEGESELAVSAGGSSLAELMAGLPDIPFTTEATARLSPERVALSPLSVTFGDSDLAGEVSAGTGETTDIEATLTSNLIDMTPFVAQDEETEGESTEAAAEEAAAEEAAAEEEAAEDAPASEYVFPEEPFDFASIADIDVDADVSIARFVMESLELTDIRSVTAFHDGALTVKHTMGTPGGGNSETDLMFKATGNIADLVLMSTLNDLKLNIFSGEDADISVVPATSVTLDITASGDSPRTMASATDGRLLLTQGPGRVENNLVGRFSGGIIAQLFDALNPLSEEEEYSNWECSIFAVDFVDGLGEISGFLLQGEKLQIVGGGTIDLNTEELNIEFNTKPREGVGLSADMFVTPFVKLSGTLAEPGVGLNKKGVLLSGGAAFLTGGLSFLFQGAADRATAEAGLCEKTLTEVGGHGAGAPGAAPATPAPQPETEKQE